VNTEPSLSPDAFGVGAGMAIGVVDILPLLARDGRSRSRVGYDMTGDRAGWGCLVMDDAIRSPVYAMVLSRSLRPDASLPGLDGCVAECSESDERDVLEMMLPLCFQ
jgi:hypothetical protein